MEWRGDLALPKDVIGLIMLMIEHSPTYLNFIVTARFTYEFALKHERRRKRELKGILPPLMLSPTLDFVKDLAVIPRSGESGIVGLVKGARVGADPIKEYEGGCVERRGDLVEITLDEDGVINIEGAAYQVTAGKWWFPLICLTWQSVRVETKCRIQYFYLHSDERHVLAITQGLFTTLGGASIMFTSGMHGVCDPKLGNLWDGHTYTKRMEGTGEFKITFSGHDYDEVKQLYSRIGECDDVDKSTEPTGRSWLLQGQHDPMSFTITTRDKESVAFWFRECGGETNNIQGTVSETKEDVTTPEEIEEQKRMVWQNTLRD